MDEMTIERCLFGLEPEENNAWAAKILVSDPDLDFKACIRAAAVEFLQTPEGQRILAHNCGAFNWGDAIEELPEDLCLKHGFRISEMVSADELVDINEQLTNI